MIRDYALMKRIDALDGLRGVLALIVAASHLLDRLDIKILDWPAALSVMCFFVMSGYVLAIGYDGRPLVFLARRVVRLWPVYAVTLVAGYAVLRAVPPVGDLLMWPPSPSSHRLVDGPNWSLYLELWASPALLPMFWIAAHGRIAALLAAAIACALMLAEPSALVIGYFAVGVAAARFEIGLPKHVPAWTLWLGRVSYSLYLSHWVIIAGCVASLGRPGVAVAAGLILPVAWLVWRYVELPSIGWSRALAAHRIVPASGSRRARSASQIWQLFPTRP
jgi:peptidoglycan/LPS O-acetylase OafA/YrhL